MKDSTLLQQIREVNELRGYLDSTAESFPAEYVRKEVQREYGRTVSRTTWGRWCLKCGVTQSLLQRYGGEYPAGAFLLLMVNAKLLRGNGPDERRKKITRPMLVQAVKNCRRRCLPLGAEQLPSKVAPKRLEAIAEAQASRSYSSRAHRMKGIKRSRSYYTRAEAAEILKNYPTFKLGA